MLLTLITTALYNTFLAVIIYFAEKKTFFGRLKYRTRQIVIGLLFGAMAAFASTSLAGVDIGDGTIMNVRDAAPLCAGLIFGAPAGVISGIIGGLFRYVSAFFGITGTYTQLACSISTALAGLIAAALRKFMFDDKKPGWIYCFGIGTLCEVIHMLMIFFTNADDPGAAFNFVKVCSLPMMLLNGFSVGAAALIISVSSGVKRGMPREKRHISVTFQLWLFICIVAAYFLTSAYTFLLQSKMSDAETAAVIKSALDDVHKSITDVSDKNLLEKAEKIKAEYLASDKSSAALQSLSEEYGVAEIDVIGVDGVISNSSNAKYVDFDMASGSQSREFLEHMGAGQHSYVQRYQAQAYDQSIYRKYGAVALEDGGFLQVGYNGAEFQADIDSYVGEMTRNRHIGNDGFILICGENWGVVSEGSAYTGQKLANMGVSIDTELTAQNEIFNINLGKTAYKAAYTFAEGYYILGLIPVGEALYMRDVSVYLSSFMEILIFAVLFVLVYFLIKKLIIDNLIKVNHALAKITSGNLDVTVDVRANEEFASLSDDINSTVNTLKRYISEAEARIDAELEFAKQIQCSALPSVFPPYPSRKEFDIYAQMDPAKEVGGDFYDFYMTGNSTIAFLIADVSGKGIPAAMFMMRAKAIIKDLAESGLDVDEIFTRANEKLCENNDAGMFVTAWMAVVDLKTGVMSIANAGHNPPLIKRSGGKFVYEKQRPGFVLAGMEGIKYRKTEIQLFPGDQVYLYTDGVTETTDAENRLYGEERLEKLLNAQTDTDVKALCRAVKQSIDRFAGDAPQFDDTTMVTFRLNYIAGDDRILFTPNKDAAAAVSDFAQRLTSKLNILPSISGKVNIVIDETSSNIINYSGAELAEISYVAESGRLVLRFEDNGAPYDPLLAKEPDITLSAEERQIGGLGIFMVKKMAEAMDYKYENGKNILSVTMALK